MTAIKKIKSFNAQPARNAEFVEFTFHVLGFVTASRAELLGIGALRAEYDALYVELDKSFKINQKYELTATVQELDKKRDAALKFVLQTIAANLSNPETAKQQAASKLDYVVSPYKKAASSTLYAESAEIDNLLQDINSSANLSAVTALSLAAGLAALKSANELFREVYDYRVDEKTNRDAVESMKVIRPQVDTSYRALASAINSLNEVNELVTNDTNHRFLLTQIIDAINGQIEWLENTIQVRKTKAENKKKEEEKK